MPEEEPLAGLLHICLAVAAEDLGDLGLDLAQRDLAPSLPAVPQPVDELVIPCDMRLCCFRKGGNLSGLNLDSFNFMDQIKKVADLGEIFR